MKQRVKATLIPLAPHESRPRVPLNNALNMLAASHSGPADQAGSGCPHVVILNDAGALYARDVTGGAKMAVNGAAASRAPLKHKDRVRLGVLEYEVSIPRAAAPQAAPNGAPARLVSRLQAFACTEPITVIGRSAGADIRLENPDVGELHGMILRVGGRYWYHGFGTNGRTRLNGQPVHRAVLAEGDLLEIGMDQYRLETAAPEAPPAQDAAEASGPSHAVPPEESKDAGPADADRPEPPPAEPPQPIAAQSPKDAGQVPEANSSPAAKPAIPLERIRKWGALAYAVVSTQMTDAHFEQQEAQGGRRGWIWAVMVIVLLLGLCAAGVYFGIKYLK